MRTQEVITAEAQYLVHTYTRPPFVLERGNGMHLFDTEGNRYLDFVSGIGVNVLGYGDYEVLEVLGEQARRLIHTSNLFYTEPQVVLAKMLVERSFADRVFFCNSGAEAVEAALKFARRWGHERFSSPKTRVLAMHNSFHGRTYGALSVTGQSKYHRGFEPLLPGVDFAQFNDLDSVEKSLTPQTCAVIVEPPQAEGGVIPAQREFLQGLRELCDERGMLLIFDEVQFGLARSGELFTYQHYGVEPDIVTLAKPLGGGLPLGAVLVREEVAQYIGPGDHASTFGGGPLACSVGIKVLEKLSDLQFLRKVRENGEYLHSRLMRLQARRSEVKEVRGIGLIAGVDTEFEAKALVEEFRKRGVLVCTAGSNTLRFIPPLIVEQRHIDEAVDVFHEVLEQGVQA
ncbi:MAG TPA: aspartate aminotransferase family protein [Candidatus Latescibacteria bacterium]|nr:aspartate aminotransferase family protein [Candidatus Latescibacterota bacterium]